MSVLVDAALEINLGALEFNYRLMRTIVDRGTEVAAVVKSDAYGLGLARVSQMLFRAGCRQFFVANMDEALLLRAACPAATIVVFNANITKSWEAFQAEDLVAVVNGEDDLRTVIAGRGSLPYYLNLETGFSRFGLTPDRLLNFREAGTLRNAPPRCLFSHLACSDDAQDLANRQQRDRFTAATKAFPEARRSLSASAGVWLGRSYHFDIVRIGSALFGLNNARIHPNPLRPVATLRAPLVEIRHVPARQAIGYGATFRTRRPTRLGIVAIGYKHGLPWACANKLRVRIGDFYAPVVGRIAMEYTTIDLTDVSEAALKRGSRVDFLYDGFGVDDLATAAGVNAQEILIRLGACCPRQYATDRLGLPTVGSAFGPHGDAPFPSAKVA